MFCTECGTALADNAKFCTKCGARQDGAAAPTPAPAPAAAPLMAEMPVEVPSRSPGGLRKLWLGLGAAVLVGAGALGWSYLPGTGAAGAGSSDPFATWPLPVTIGDKCGAIDQTGKLVISPAYEQVGHFFGGSLAPVKLPGGKWGYIDKTGKLAINPQFDRAREFIDGLAIVELADRFGMIGTDGTFKVQPQYSRLEVLRYYERDGLADYRPVIKARDANRRWGLLDGKGQVLVAPQFDEINCPLNSRGSSSD